MKNLKRKIIALTALLAVLLTAASCSGKYALKNRAEAPKPDFVRRISIILERPDFSPIKEADVLVEVKEPTKLLLPSSGRTKSDSNGKVELQFGPLPHYQQEAWSGGDIIVDFPVKAQITVYPFTAHAVSYDIDDLESFARFSDPLYQGLNRDPDSAESFFLLSIP